MKNYITILLLISAVTFGQTQDSVQSLPGNSATGKIFLSRDQGDTWQRVDNGFPENGSINSWVVSGRRVIVGTEEHGIYISEDGLKTWLPSNKGLPRNLKVNAVAVYKNLLLAGSYLDGVFISYDEGSTWEPFSQGIENLTVRCFYSVGNRLFVGTDKGIYSSAGDGSWTKQFQGAQINAFEIVGKNMFAATNQGALRSQDFGKTWSWVWKRGVIFGFGVKGSNLVSFASADHIYEGWNEGTNWIILNSSFRPPITFRITPSSGVKLVFPWENVFRSLRNKETFRSDGLPDNASFMEILETPFGILVGVSFDGC